MSNLKFKFLEETPNAKPLTDVEKTMYEIGDAICKYAKGYFYFVINGFPFENNLKTVSFHLIIPELSFDYKVFSVDRIDSDKLGLTYFTIDSERENEEPIVINKKELKSRINTYINSEIGNNKFKKLITLIENQRQEIVEDDDSYEGEDALETVYIYLEKESQAFSDGENEE